MAGRHRAAPRVRAQKRLSTWLDVVPSGVTFTVTGGTIIGTLNAAALALRPFTVVRTHLQCLLITD